MLQLEWLPFFFVWHETRRGVRAGLIDPACGLGEVFLIAPEVLSIKPNGAERLDLEIDARLPLGERGRQGKRDIDETPRCLGFVLARVEHVVIALMAVSELQSVGEEHEAPGIMPFVGAPQFHGDIILECGVRFRGPFHRAALPGKLPAGKEAARGLIESAAQRFAPLSLEAVRLFGRFVAEDDGVDGGGPGSGFGRGNRSGFFVIEESGDERARRDAAC